MPQARHACQLPNHPESVGRARAWLRTILTADGCCEDAIDTAVLIMSELATNGLMHGSQHRSDTITIVCELDSYILTAGVVDYGSGQPVILDAGEDAEFGRGWPWLRTWPTIGVKSHATAGSWFTRG